MINDRFILSHEDVLDLFRKFNMQSYETCSSLVNINEKNTSL